jgi:hypothetical protein
MAHRVTLVSVIGGLTIRGLLAIAFAIAGQGMVQAQERPAMPNAKVSAKLRSPETVIGVIALGGTAERIREAGLRANTRTCVSLSVAMRLADLLSGFPTSIESAFRSRLRLATLTRTR